MSSKTSFAFASFSRLGSCLVDRLSVGLLVCGMVSPLSADDTPSGADARPAVKIRLQLSPKTVESLHAEQDSSPPAKPLTKTPANTMLAADTASPAARSHEQSPASIQGTNLHRLLPKKPGIAEMSIVTQCIYQQGEKTSGDEPPKLPTNSTSLPLTSSSRKRMGSDSAQTKRTDEQSTDEVSLPVAKHQDSVGNKSIKTTLELPEQDPGNSKQEIESKTADPLLPLESSSRNQLRDPSSLDEEQGGECPGAPTGGSNSPPESHEDDIPFEQDEHPYDAPAAKSIEEAQLSLRPVETLSPREERIRDGISVCLQYFIDHPETVVRRGPWALMHAALPFGVESEVIAGNKRVNTLGWMCYNGVCSKQRMFQPTRTGFRTNVGPGVQGHEGQFLAILAQSKVQSDYPLQIGNRKYSIKDLVRYEMPPCREKSELTFKLIGLSYYLDQNQQWRDSRGHTWNLEKMVAEELAQPVNGAACGGSHRLMGLSFAVIQRQKSGLPITGNWARAEKYLNEYVNYAMTLQNPDGSFSTEWFESRGREEDRERKIQTTGHILEWLIYTLPDEHLRSPRIQSSVEFLTNTMGADLGHDWPIGPRGHALRAMSLYSQRVFGAEPGRLKAFIAESQSSGVLR